MAVREVKERLVCPACGGPMEPFNYGGDTGILLDKCPRCGGIWLDAGELEKVQRVVEAWDAALPDDLRRHGMRLRQVATREEARAEDDARKSPYLASGALLNRILDI